MKRWTTQQRSLVGASLAHALHDGYTDSLYAFLPVWQGQFGLSYAALALVRSLYYATMGGLQIPADHALRKLSPRAALILSTVIALTGLLMMALPFGFAGLCVGLVLAGVGSSIQHRADRCLSPIVMAARRDARSASTIFQAISAKRYCRRSWRCCCRCSPGEPYWA